jgi:hypothetical protein
MKNNMKQVRILSSESYAQSSERMEILQDLIRDGIEAQSVLKFAEKLLAEIERETLETLKKPNANHKEAADYYRIAVRFVDMLKAAISLGEQKTEAFEKLKRNS